ncbi:MAG: PilN domain-containing protein [Candidatus Omnitrophica bacterium]|nr:PilN domain-containing protein [Candidatus Omnitrophota bacterium]
MIEINLLPEELRAKAKAKPKKEGANLAAMGLKAKKALNLIPIVVVILVFVHVILFILDLNSKAQMGVLDVKWKMLESKRKALDEFNKETSAQAKDALETQDLVSKRILWAQKLNRLSLDLPSGIWFTNVTINAKELSLNGSVVSLQKEEVNLINKFIDTLKKDPVFIKDFSNIALNQVQKKSIGTFEIADFILVCALKTK